MKPVFIIFVLCSLYQTLATASTINYADVDCGISKYSNRSMRVVNGETADKGEFPWVVSLKIGKHHFCGGVLIRKNWILTAAHCFNNREVSEIRIGAGEIARYPNQMEFPTLAVDKLIMHPFYKKEDHTHDIALIRMSGSFTWNELVQPICLSDLHLLLDPKLDEEASHLPSGDFGLLDETDPSSFRFSDMTIINELVNSSLIEAHKPSVDEEKLTLSNIPMTILAALSRLLTAGGDKDETISRTRSTESRAIAPSSSKVISDSIPFHPRNISLSNHLNEVSDSSPLSGMMATIVGWGFTGEKERGGQRSEMLLKVDVPIVANDKCQTWFKEESIKENTKLVVINDARICAGFESGGKDSCLGDSGGPLIVKQKGKYMVIGVVSTGIGCGRPKLPGIYTRVSSYFDWITENLESS